VKAKVHQKKEAMQSVGADLAAVVEGVVVEEDEDLLVAFIGEGEAPGEEEQPVEVIRR